MTMSSSDPALLDEQTIAIMAATFLAADSFCHGTGGQSFLDPEEEDRTAEMSWEELRDATGPIGGYAEGDEPQAADDGRPTREDIAISWSKEVLDLVKKSMKR